jgi:tetratricopeptide (TPR) repeat protein
VSIPCLLSLPYIVIDRLKSYLFERNRYNIGLEIIASARITAEAAQSPDYKLLSDLHRLEGRLCNEANLPMRGLDAFQCAFRLAKRAIAVGQLESNDTRCVRTLTGWGNCLNQLGRFDEALDLQLQASEACATEPEKHGDALSIVLLNLGYVYFRRGNLDKAQDALQQAQALEEKLQPVLYVLANLAILRGQVECGLKLHLEALKLYMDEFGEQHHCVADSLFKVGETYLRMNKLSEAM